MPAKTISQRSIKHTRYIANALITKSIKKACRKQASMLINFTNYSPFLKGVTGK